MNSSMLDSLEQMLQQGKDSPLLRFGLGNEYFKRKDYARAITHLLKAVELDVKYSAAWKLLGRAYTESGDKPAAISAFERGIHVAQQQGDQQAMKEMQVFVRRLQRSDAHSDHRP